MIIRPLLGGDSDDPTYLQFVKLIHSVLEAFVPAFSEGRDLKSQLQNELPFLLKREGRASAENISFLLLAKCRPDAFKFYFEMIYRWLVPDETLNVVMIHAVDFTLPVLGDTVYTLSEIIVRVTDEKIHKKIDEALPLIESEIKRGVISRREAEKILESKGYKQDEKTARLQRLLGERIDRFPSIYETDVLREMQHTLLLAPEGFKAKRRVNHLLRLILYQYRFRKNLAKHIQELPHKRRVFLKLFRLSYEGKGRLGILVGLNFLEEKEVFEEKQLMGALQHHFNFLRPVSASSLTQRHGKELLTIVYTEIEPLSGLSFTPSEILEIERELPQALLSHIEYLMHPVFMPRNEEEVMRNTLALAHQLRQVSDLPQGVITFDQQSRTHLYFTVILVRSVNKNTPSINELFKKQPGPFTFFLDRVKIIGKIGRYHKKEATIFRLRVGKEAFLRLDHSLDLYKARQELVNNVTQTVGEFRDFNGGMIAKKEELLDKVKHLLPNKYHAIWLENLFYSLSPVAMQTMLEPHLFCRLFLLVSECLRKGLPLDETFIPYVEEGDSALFVVVLTHDRSVIDQFEPLANAIHHPSRDAVVGEVFQGDTYAIAFIFRDGFEAVRNNLEANSALVS